MASEIVQIAEAVRDELVGGSFSQDVIVQRLYRPLFEAKDLDTAHVTVVPAKAEDSTEARRIRTRMVTIGVAVQRRVAAGDVAACDAMMGLLEEVAAFLVARRLAVFPAARWREQAIDPIYAPDHLDAKGVFTAVIRVTYRLSSEMQT